MPENEMLRQSTVEQDNLCFLFISGYDIMNVNEKNEPVHSAGGEC